MREHLAGIVAAIVLLLGFTHQRVRPAKHHPGGNRDRQHRSLHSRRPSHGDPRQDRRCHYQRGGRDRKLPVHRSATRALHTHGPGARLSNRDARGRRSERGRTGSVELYPGGEHGGHDRRGRDPRGPSVGHRVNRADRRHYPPRYHPSGSYRSDRSVADDCPIVQCQHPTDQRRFDHRTAGHAAQLGARPHAGPDQREAPPPLVDHRLARW